ncbi:MAG: chemotaxis response regulator protein-glutamate methylesterase [Desulfuromonadia bacterium]
MDRIRILVIDDSAYSRRTITRMLEEMPEVEVIGYASNGEEGMRRILELRPDLVTLDLEMPVMDGFTLLRIIMSRNPLPVIVISSRNDDERVFKALELGALDFIAKPGGPISVELMNIKEDLHRKVRSISSLNRSSIHSRSPSGPPSAIPPVEGGGTRYDLLAVGASTGGPPALQRLLTSLPKQLPCGVLIAQHMPTGFTKAFADRLNRLSPFPIREAVDSEPVVAGVVLIAPGGKNMTVNRRGGRPVIALSDPSPAERYVPSVDRLFTSAAEIYGDRLLSFVLTGMGSDGAEGVRAVKSRGGRVFAESEETAIVYGMPREAVLTGCVDRIVPLDAAAGEIMACLAGKSPEGGGDHGK